MYIDGSVQFSSVAQSCPTLCDPMNHSTPGLPPSPTWSITNSWSSLRLASIESVMPSSHVILCRPLLLLPPTPPCKKLLKINFLPIPFNHVTNAHDVLPLRPNKILQGSQKQRKIQFSSVQSSRSVVSDSLRPHESQHARPPCPSPTPGVHSDSRPSSR